MPAALPRPAAIPILEVSGRAVHPEAWRYLWLKYVRGFRPGVHCANCLVGAYSERIGPDTSISAGALISLDEASGYRHLYLCGVARRGGWAANLHLAAIPEAGAVAEVTASSGTVFRIRNARAVPIPPLEPGFAGKSARFTTCRNWQFGVAEYGLGPARLPFEPPDPLSDLPANPD